MLFENGLAVHDIRYQGFREQDGARHIPETILVAFDRYATSLEIKLQDPLTDPIEPGQLALQAPDGTVFLPLHTFFEDAVKMCFPDVPVRQASERTGCSKMIRARRANS